jgi:hypothetical protein
MKDVKICIILIATFNKSFDIFKDRSKVEFLLLLFLTLESTFCSIDVFFSDYSFFLSLMTIPSTDIFDCFDRSKLVVININIVGYTYKRLVHISNRI